MYRARSTKGYFGFSKDRNINMAILGRTLDFSQTDTAALFNKSTNESKIEARLPAKITTKHRAATSYPTSSPFLSIFIVQVKIQTPTLLYGLGVHQTVV